MRWAVSLLLALSVLSTTASAQVLFDELGTAMPYDSGSQIVLNGSAVQMDRFLRLTPSLRIQTGSAWLADRQDVQNGFSTMFQFQMSGRGDVFPNGITEDTGGDGFALVIQNEGPRAMGNPGGGIGYAGIANSLAVEFDTWDNNESGHFLLRDPDDNHVSVQTRGTAPNSEFKGCSLGLTPNLPELSDGEIHTVKIEYVPGMLAIYVDDMQLPVLAVKADLSTILALEDGKAWVGFTAATWDAFENHDILNWAFTGARP